MMLILPLASHLSFSIFSPFSIFKPIAFLSTILGTSFTFYLAISDDLDFIARKDKTNLGKVVRYRFQQLSAYDGLKMSYIKETKHYDVKGQ
mmetsp:Transcript_2580/g.4323  ORF Transcript_2580/g.4323 Transcript_2580/m.4323 type:complete len:91 (-) Transcript_2580:88-360(-)